ncbi:hypothetical protein Tco_0953195 [Tanacetum coccineum]|uniref:Uncharacterized protein n=1 Tax=Tanacetum coccineum TaxID=301880 RepID=A0ABQ5DZ67_9ASTR
MPSILNNVVTRRVIDDLIDISGERSPLKYLKIFIEQQINDHTSVISLLYAWRAIWTSTNLISQLNALIAELEASGLIVVAEEKIHGKEIDLEMLEAEVVFECEAPIVSFSSAVGCANIEFLQNQLVFRIYDDYKPIIMETQAIDDQDPLVNYDNDNENDDLGYQSEVQEDDENNHSNGNVVKRGITRLYKFHREYRKPDGIKLSVTFDALNRISGKHRALFLSFLGDMVREHIGLKILSWKKVDSEARDKL